MFLKNFKETFWKRSKKVFFIRKKTFNMYFYKKKNFFYIKKRKFFEITKKKNYNYKYIIDNFLKSFFKKINFMRIYNVKKTSFLKNRKVMLDTVHIKYLKSYNLYNKAIRKIYLTKNFFTKSLFWYKFTMPNLKKGKKNLRKHVEIEKYLNATSTEKNVFDLNF